MISHGTINSYVGALLTFLRNIDISYSDENKNLITKNIPIMYTSKEKSDSLEFLNAEDIKTGNVNILPRGTLALVSIQKREEASLNRNIKVNKTRTDNKIEYSFNSVPYSFIFEFNIFCRGMNELASLIEIILPNFNPNLSLDIYDVANLDEPTRVPLKLMDVTFSEVEENSETSKNIWMLTFSMQMDGQVYQQIKTTNLLKEYDMLTNVNKGYNYLESVNNPIYSAFFKKNTLKKGENTIEVVFKSALDIPEISFEISDDIKFKQKSNKITFNLTDDVLSKLQNNFVLIKCNLKTVSDSLSISNKFYIS
jgi:hypothetical protein